MKLYFIVFGSSIDTWRPERSSGNTLAEGCSEPFWQKAGFLGPRTAAANHTRPFLSNMPLWLLAFVSQIFSSPQYADGAAGFSIAACPGPGASGVSVARTGIVNVVTVCVLGSRMGITSVAYSGEPKSLPYALTVGWRRSDAIRSWRYFFGSPHSHVVTTMLRSTPCGRVGFVCGSSPFATRSVQSAKYLNGALPSAWASGPIMNGAACPDVTRRIHAASDDGKSPSDLGIVRVESWPS